MREYVKTGELWGLLYSGEGERPPIDVQFDEPSSQEEFIEKVHQNEKQFGTEESFENTDISSFFYEQLSYDLISVFICVFAIM